MRAVEIRARFGLEELELVERPEPEPGPGELLLQVEAVALNYRDLLMVRGEYNPRQPLPLVPCSDAAAEVVGLGPGVTGFKVGDRVVTSFVQDWRSGEVDSEGMRSTLGGPRNGVLQERMVLPCHGVVKLPSTVTSRDGATLTCAGVTAWNALFSHGSLRPGDSVLVLGTGGVSLFAVQLARLAGARVFVTSSRDDRIERAVELGASAGVNYRETPRWGRRVRELNGGRGVDVVVEVGGSSTLAESVSALRPGGRASLVGMLGGSSSELSVTPVFMKRVQLDGIFVGSRSDLQDLLRAVEQHALAPVIDRVWPVAQAREALEYMARGAHFGKIVLEWEATSSA